MAWETYISDGMVVSCEASAVMEEIVGLVERFESLKDRERSEVAAILKKYAEGEIGLEEVHYTLLDEGLIPMPSRCTMYHKPEQKPEAEVALRSLIREKIQGL
ncbi:MAG: hypothetical protein METHAR1v1_400003 [Methanothrix sp.]|nr:MAG: hypothetical protein METHAR1v1_400003 [Methanothrix sp.]